MKAIIQPLKILAVFTAVILITHEMEGKDFSISSPDTSIGVKVRVTEQVYYNLSVDGTEVMAFSPLAMKTTHGMYGTKGTLLEDTTRQVDEVITPVWGIRAKVRDQYNELQLDFKEGYSILFRAYNDGVAYRFRSTRPGELIVHDELIEYRFPEHQEMLNLHLDSFYTSYEKFYTSQTTREVTVDHLIGLPSIVDTGTVKLAIMESDLFDYPGFYLSKVGQHRRPTLNGKLAPYPSSLVIGGSNNFDLVVTETEDYICRTRGNRDFPWRVIAVARSDIELADSNLVYKLARPSQIETDWIKPGIVAWDWWNAMNLSGVDFETGINTRTYEYFIDFASRNEIPYVILDEGWSDQYDLFNLSTEVDVQHLARYAEEKGVRLILWVIADTIDRQSEKALKQFQEWGIAGIKVDFIDRDDQVAIAFYERMAAEAAKYELLVDYHGCSKPTGLHRTYPNVINFEAVRGNEYYKFSNNPSSPEQEVNIAFARMMAGPLDFTPGSMRNTVEERFVKSRPLPMTYGTRAHQLGMFVVYFAPLQMLCDAPTAYEQYPDILNTLSSVPTTWDETKVLSGKIGEHIVIARQKGEDWYIGGLNNWEEREVSIDLSNFTEGPYTAMVFRDSINSNRNPEDYVYENYPVFKEKSLTLRMKKGGGFLIHLEKRMP